jgi:hypothetical protein
VAKWSDAFQRTVRQVQSSSLALMAVIVIPLQNSGEWKQESYSKIQKNEVVFSTSGLLVKVNKSASPLFYPLLPTKKIGGFRVSGEFRGLPKFNASAVQGSKGADDFALRVGFVSPGANRLSGLKRFFAPAWIKNLYSAIPSDSGVEKVRFFNVTQTKALLGKSRLHPSSDLISEENFVMAERKGPFDYSYDFKEPIETAAIWISIDGDDTNSKYDVLISKLEILEK